MSDQSKDVDINQAFEDLLLAEDLAEQAGYDEGFETGKTQLVDGYHLGYHRASSLAAQLGYYFGVLICIQKTCDNSKILEKIEALLKDIQTFPPDNSETVDVFDKFENEINWIFERRIAQSTKMSEQEKYLMTIIGFLKKYQNLIDCHLVDFFTDDLWNKYVPVDLKSCIEKLGETNVLNAFEAHNELHENESSELQEFLKTVSNLQLKNCPDICLREDFIGRLNDAKIPFQKSNDSEFMKVKKWHEIDVYTKAIAWLIEDKPSIIIDAGAGKGYSSFHLSNYYSLPTIAIECSEVNHKGAIAHQELVNKKVKQSKPMVNFVVKQIDETTNFVNIAKDYYPDLYPQSELALTALHACGSLSDSVIKSFLNVSDMKSLCLVPCCYHLASKSLSSVYEFSKNSRMLAQQSTDRIKRNTDALSPSLFYRAVIQVVFKLFGIEKAQIGRRAPLDSFPIYAKWALKKLNVHELPTDEYLEDVYNKYLTFRWKFQIFQLLRIELAAIIEAAIILDKVIFMQRGKLCKKLELIQLFDPLKSPRNWAIIATK